MVCPPPPALSPQLCCSGGAPWCSAIPSPTPGLQRRPFRGPRPQQGTDLRGEPWPHGVAILPPARPPCHLSCRLTSPWLRVTLPPPRLPSFPQTPLPSCQRTRRAPPLLGDPPGAALPSCPQHPLLSSSCDWGGLSGMKQQTEAKPNICNICLSVPIDLAQPPQAQPGARRRRVWPLGRGLRPVAAPKLLSCPRFHARPLNLLLPFCFFLSLLLGLFFFSFLFSSNFLCFLLDQS